MRRPILILLSLLITVMCYSQKKLDVVYTTEGSVFRGVIVDSSSQKIFVETQCGNTMAVYKDSVVSIKEEVFIDKRAIKDMGYICFFSGGALFGSSANELQAPFSMLIESNWRVNKYFSMGITSGLEMLNEATVPIALNIKGLFPLNDGITGYIGGMAGYSLSIEDAHDTYWEITNSYGGNMVSFEAGIIFPSYGNLSFFLAAGYRYNELNYSREDWALNTVDRTIYYNRISLRVGLLFF